MTQPTTPPPPTVVVVSKPSVVIIKDPKSQTIGKGGTATFTITVTNSGDVALTHVTVTDPLSSACDHTFAGTLAVGASEHYSCARPDVKADFTNVATVTANPPTGPKVSATDHAQVTVAPFTPPAHPAIGIVKSPKVQTVTTKVVTTKNANGVTKTSVTFGTAHFTIKVSNTGSTSLEGVTVADALSPGCDRSVGKLAEGHSVTYTCSDASVKRNFTNVAIATGHDSKGTKVSARDHAKVEVTTTTTSTSGAQFTG